MKENIKYLFKNLRSYLQNKNSSYEKHHDQYDQPDSLIYHREIYKQYHNDVLINNSGHSINVMEFFILSKKSNSSNSLIFLILYIS